MSNQTRLELHARNGGADAATFTRELADAIAKHSRSTYTLDGTTATFHRL